MDDGDANFIRFSKRFDLYIRGIHYVLTKRAIKKKKSPPLKVNQLAGAYKKVFNDRLEWDALLGRGHTESHVSDLLDYVKIFIIKEDMSIFPIPLDHPGDFDAPHKNDLLQVLYKRVLRPDLEETSVQTGSLEPNPNEERQETKTQYTWQRFDAPKVTYSDVPTHHGPSMCADAHPATSPPFVTTPAPPFVTTPAEDDLYDPFHSVTDDTKEKNLGNAGGGSGVGGVGGVGGESGSPRWPSAQEDDAEDGTWSSLSAAFNETTPVVPGESAGETTHGGLGLNSENNDGQQPTVSVPVLAGHRNPENNNEGPPRMSLRVDNECPPWRAYARATRKQ